MPEGVQAAGVTTEDVRRAYYDSSSTPMSWWITELQLAPTPQLIVCDEASANIYRIPITIKGTDVSFGDPVQVQVEYQDLAADGTPVAAARWGSPVKARAGITAAWNGGQQVKNLGSDPTASQIKALFALPGDTKSASKLPHHDVTSDGVVGAADTDGVEAALAALNGSQGGLKDVSDEDKKAAYDHLAAHYKAAGKTAPPLMAASRSRGRSTESTPTRTRRWAARAATPSTTTPTPTTETRSTTITALPQPVRK